MRPRVRIISPDGAFADTLGQRLHGWGVSVAIEGDFRGVAPPDAYGQDDVFLLDVRGCEDGLLGWLADLKRALPALEVVLLALPGQVAFSIAAMRAGASSELSAPFDLAALRGAVSAALRRRRKRLDGRPSLLARFQQAMSAATFAQAGEFETAKEMLEGEGKRGRRGRGDTER